MIPLGKIDLMKNFSFFWGWGKTILTSFLIRLKMWNNEQESSSWNCSGKTKDEDEGGNYRRDKGFKKSYHEKDIAVRGRKKLNGRNWYRKRNGRSLKPTPSFFYHFKAKISQLFYFNGQLVLFLFVRFRIQQFGLLRVRYEKLLNQSDG